MTLSNFSENRRTKNGSFASEGQFNRPLSDLSENLDALNADASDISSDVSDISDIRGHVSNLSSRVTESFTSISDVSDRLVGWDRGSVTTEITSDSEISSSDTLSGSRVETENFDLRSGNSFIFDSDASFAGEVRQNVVDRSGQVYNVKAFGAAGDGTTNDLDSFRSAVSKASNDGGGLVFCPPATYNIDSILTLQNRVALRGSGISQTVLDFGNNAGKPALDVNGNDVAVQDLTLKGPQNASVAGGEDGIRAIGSSSSDSITGLIVDNTEIHTFGDAAVFIKFTTGAQITRNHLRDVVTAGVLGRSVADTDISLNHIEDVTGTSGSAWGVNLAREDKDSLTSHPRSEGFTIIGNRIRNIENWEGINTHAGRDGVISNNVILDSTRGIAVIPEDDGSSTQSFAPLFVTVSGNVIDSQVTDGTARAGIVIQGVEAHELAKGISVTGNSVIRHGDESDQGRPAMRARGTLGLTVVGNTFLEPAPHGINLISTNTGFSVANNTIVDPWTDTASRAVGVLSDGQDNVGYIGENSIRSESKAATTKLTAAIRVDNASGSTIELGRVPTNAGVVLSDAGDRTQRTHEEATRFVERPGGDSSRDPSNSSADDWIEVSIDGSQHFIPAYNS